MIMEHESKEYFNISTAITLGACDFVVKPFNLDALRKK